LSWNRIPVSDFFAEEKRALMEEQLKKLEQEQQKTPQKK
jgi:hypothetical protein